MNPFFLFVALVLSFSSLVTSATEETRLLEARNAEFEREVIQVTDDVYTAVGYSVQPVSMIIGKDGIIIVDTGIDVASAEAVLKSFRKITKKPVKCIILTHSHPDHTGGLEAFTRDGSPQIWGRDNFGDEANTLKSAGLTIGSVRGARQGGFKLPAEKRINNGIARAYYPQRNGEVFGSTGGVKLTHMVHGENEEIEVAGVKLELKAVIGETYDSLYVWYPSKRVLFSGDNYYKSWPNLYPIRGVPYRDVREWANTIDQMLNEGPNFLVPGHTRPVIGKEKIAEVLTDYRDAIRYVFNKTIEGMNKGLSPDELVEYVQLPQRFKDKDHLRSYYGDPEWAVRSIFSYYLGWFDGNPSNLFPLSPVEEAKRIAKLAGGDEALLKQAEEAFANQDYQWAAQLCDYLISLDANNKIPKLLKADALEQIAESVLSGIGRNYYLTVAQELRRAAAE